MLEAQAPKDIIEINTQKQQKSQAAILFLSISVFALGQALETGGHFNSRALIGLTICIIFLLASVMIPRNSHFLNIPTTVVFSIIILEVMIQLFELYYFKPISPLPAELIDRLWQFRLWIALAGTFALLSLLLPKGVNRWIKRVVVALVFISILSAGIWIIQGSPHPGIDVFVFQQNSSRALSRLQNPYETTIPNIYKDTRFYGADLVKDGMLTIGNPYPPLSIYFAYIGYALAGDIRYSYLLAILLSGLILLSLNSDRIGLLITYLFLFTPRIFLVLKSSWTEPFVVLVVLVVIWCAINKPKWIFIALGLLLASKQYMLFLLPTFGFLFPIHANVQQKIKSAVITVSVAFLVTAPMAFWNFSAFLWNVGLMQWNQPFRFDSLSYLVIIANVFGQQFTPYIPFIALLAAMIISHWFLKPSPIGFAISLALGLMLFFAFNKQAFSNYYFLVIGIMSAAALSQRDLRLGNKAWTADEVD